MVVCPQLFQRLKIPRPRLRANRNKLFSQEFSLLGFELGFSNDSAFSKIIQLEQFCVDVVLLGLSQSGRFGGLDFDNRVRSFLELRPTKFGVVSIKAHKLNLGLGEVGKNEWRLGLLRTHDLKSLLPALAEICGLAYGITFQRSRSCESGCRLPRHQVSIFSDWYNSGVRGATRKGER